MKTLIIIFVIVGILVSVAVISYVVYDFVREVVKNRKKDDQQKSLNNQRKED